ncbi:hypothetical protein HYX12_03055 [Candidatus Woesearchaeota archaeon]|nr:hypothetical protein [Candidatus Woesearchaeota archaeon]
MLETHYERDLIINNREIIHEGVFVVTEIFHLINEVIEERGYHKKEKKFEEEVTESERKITVELRPYKEKTHYVTLMFKPRISITINREIVKEIEGIKKKYQEGNVAIFIDAWYMTEYAQRWGQKPVIFFLKGFINKMVYTFPLEAKFRNELADDVGYLTSRLKLLFRSYKGPSAALPPEEEVRIAVEEEMSKESATKSKNKEKTPKDKEHFRDRINE